MRNVIGRLLCLSPDPLGLLYTVCLQLISSRIVPTPGALRLRDGAIDGVLQSDFFFPLSHAPSNTRQYADMRLKSMYHVGRTQCESTPKSSHAPGSCGAVQGLRPTRGSFICRGSVLGLRGCPSCICNATSGDFGRAPHCQLSCGITINKLGFVRRCYLRWRVRTLRPPRFSRCQVPPGFARRRDGVPTAGKGGCPCDGPEPEARGFFFNCCHCAQAA
ncbi:hypothetical protein BS50DRAFT_43220 [Corynespora cassiicola Philippines]|uniref:Uncharacterized protein n=1 Tax=Corynespora cassiicola Philippines TaxID=1448308 RepID=A0A2T2PE71_CORCC|nr:hypothetical protein BS50DRAFT_43220 [Corynespora cassiicola Philippines]